MNTPLKDWRKQIIGPEEARRAIYVDYEANHGWAGMVREVGSSPCRS